MPGQVSLEEDCVPPSRQGCLGRCCPVRTFLQGTLHFLSFFLVRNTDALPETDRLSAITADRCRLTAGRWRIGTQQYPGWGRGVGWGRQGPRRHE